MLNHIRKALMMLHSVRLLSATISVRVFVLIPVLQLQFLAKQSCPLKETNGIVNRTLMFILDKAKILFFRNVHIF